MHREQSPGGNLYKCLREASNTLTTTSAPLVRRDSGIWWGRFVCVCVCVEGVGGMGWVS